MKLLYCPKCHDVFSLSMAEKQCICGETRGYYEADGWHAIYSGAGILLGIANDGFDAALLQQDNLNNCKKIPFCDARFDAWIVPANSDTFKKV